MPPAVQNEHNEGNDPTQPAVPKCLDCKVDTKSEEVRPEDLGILLNFGLRRAEKHRCPGCGKTWLMVVL